MRKANEFKERIKSVQEEKTKAIQQDVRLAEEALEDFYIKLENKLKMGMTPPKYTVIPKVLCEEVNKMLIEQGYYLNCNREGQTFIYFDQKDYTERAKDYKKVKQSTIKAEENKETAKEEYTDFGSFLDKVLNDMKCSCNYR